MNKLHNVCVLKDITSVDRGAHLYKLNSLQYKKYETVLFSVSKSLFIGGTKLTGNFK